MRLVSRPPICLSALSYLDASNDVPRDRHKKLIFFCFAYCLDGTDSDSLGLLGPI